MSTNTKRSHDSTPTKGGRGSPKKAKTPPEKSEQNMSLTTGGVYEIRVCRLTTGENLYKIVNENDNNDAYLRNLSDTVKDESGELKKVYKLHGELVRRVSRYDDDIMKNSKNRYYRNYFLQYSKEKKDNEKFHLDTALAIKKVRF